MKLRISRAKAGLWKNKPVIVFELNKYDLERATAYNDRDLDGYTVEVFKQKRSNDQNRYMWELITQIADRAGVIPNDVYKHAIREAGAWFTFKVKHEEFTRFCKTWEQNGVGWWVEIEEDNGEEVVCRAFRGTSSYNSLEMSRLIDWVVDEAQWYGIKTETPEQLARRKAVWNGQV